MSTQIFISYSHANESLVARLQQRLLDQGVQTWIATQSLPPGTPNWEQAIRAGLRATEIVLYAASPKAFASPYVQGELSLAQQAQKRIIPFWLDGDDWQSVAPLFLIKAQYIDARGSRFEARVTTLLHGLVGNPVNSALPQQPTLPPLGPAPALVNITPAYHLTPMALYSLGFRGYNTNTNEVEYILPPPCPVPGGPFVMGSDITPDMQAHFNETPQHPMQVNDFAIGQYPVTVAEYACFVRAGQKAPLEQTSAPASRSHHWQRQRSRRYCACATKLRIQPHQ